MTAEQVRAGSAWLALRESADAAARAPEFLDEIRSYLPVAGETIIHDLGCGTGSMVRWLAARLVGPQHWIMYDWDDELLALATAALPDGASVGARVTVETRRRDITRLDPQELVGASLVTASALLDMLTAAELKRLVIACAGVGCPILITLSVTGRVELSPSDPFDRVVRDAFNAHQRRNAGTGRRLGPDAVHAAVTEFTRLGRDVVVKPSPWRLGPDQMGLTAEWFTGWVTAACEQRPELAAETVSYARRRLAENAAGRLSVTVQHQDLLVRPR